MSIMLFGLLYGWALGFYNYWWACMCMCMCLGRDAKVKVDITD
jgi:hypothetical protein